MIDDPECDLHHTLGQNLSDLPEVWARGPDEPTTCGLTQSEQREQNGNNRLPGVSGSEVMGRDFAPDPFLIRVESGPDRVFFVLPFIGRSFIEIGYANIRIDRLLEMLIRHYIAAHGESVTRLGRIIRR